MRLLGQFFFTKKSHTHKHKDVTRQKHKKRKKCKNVTDQKAQEIKTALIISFTLLLVLCGNHICPTNNYGTFFRQNPTQI